MNPSASSLQPSFRTCPDCDGNGGYNVIDYARVTSRTITPPEKWVACETCDGSGEVEVLDLHEDEAA